MVPILIVQLVILAVIDKAVSVFLNGLALGMGAQEHQPVFLLV
jgi:hypothetical protein